MKTKCFCSQGWNISHPLCISEKYWFISKNFKISTEIPKSKVLVFATKKCLDKIEENLGKIAAGSYVIVSKKFICEEVKRLCKKNDLKLVTLFHSNVDRLSELAAKLEALTDRVIERHMSKGVLRLYNSGKSAKYDEDTDISDSEDYDLKSFFTRKPEERSRELSDDSESTLDESDDESSSGDSESDSSSDSEELPVKRPVRRVPMSKPPHAKVPFKRTISSLVRRKQVIDDSEEDPKKKSISKRRPIEVIDDSDSESDDVPKLKWQQRIDKAIEKRLANMHDVMDAEIEKMISHIETANIFESKYPVAVGIKTSGGASRILDAYAKYVDRSKLEIDTDEDDEFVVYYSYF